MNRDIEFRPYGNRQGTDAIPGAGTVWMTEDQVEAAARRIGSKTRVGGRADYTSGQSDFGMDAACVAKAYLTLVGFTEPTILQTGFVSEDRDGLLILKGQRGHVVLTQYDEDDLRHLLNQRAAGAISKAPE